MAATFTVNGCTVEGFAPKRDYLSLEDTSRIAYKVATVSYWGQNESSRGCQAGHTLCDIRSEFEEFGVWRKSQFYFHGSVIVCNFIICPVNVLLEAVK